MSPQSLTASFKCLRMKAAVLSSLYSEASTGEQVTRLSCLSRRSPSSEQAAVWSAPRRDSLWDSRPPFVYHVLGPGDPARLGLPYSSSGGCLRKTWDTPQSPQSSAVLQKGPGAGDTSPRKVPVGAVTYLPGFSGSQEGRGVEHSVVSEPLALSPDTKWRA